jgi:hypothetical protein
MNSFTRDRILHFYIVEVAKELSAAVDNEAGDDGEAIKHKGHSDASDRLTKVLGVGGTFTRPANPKGLSFPDFKDSLSTLSSMQLFHPALILGPFLHSCCALESH